MGTLAEFLACFQVEEPSLGKALDYLLSASLEKQRLTIVMPAAAIPTAKVVEHRQRLQRLAERFWPGAAPEVDIQTREVQGELRLFPLESSKYWNDLVFFLPRGESCDVVSTDGELAAGIIAKPDYEVFKQSLLENGGSADLKEMFLDAGGEVHAGLTLEALVVAAGQRAQKKRGIAHFVTLFMAAESFLALDYRFLRLKEYGARGLGPLATRSVLGHLHAVFPGQYCAGLSLVHQLSEPPRR